jgi:hypothetical protein
MVCTPRNGQSHGKEIERKCVFVSQQLLANIGKASIHLHTERRDTVVERRVAITAVLAEGKSGSSQCQRQQKRMALKILSSQK